MDISIVIPVWNESKKIESDLDAAIHFFEIHNLKGEVIVSDDGSTDDTREVIGSFLTGITLPVRVIYNNHLGKGNAVRSGIMQAKGDIILFIDSGNCISYSDVWNGIQIIRRSDCEIAHASRYLPESRILIPKGWIRRTLSLLFRKLVHRYMNIPRHLTDTQCGLKIYKKDLGQRLYQLCFTRGFMFDIEIILRAKQENILICEFPVRWSSDPDTRLSLFRSIPEIWKELRKIKRELK
jgi:glycosyltransferase involved in cell wall biosynthesis